MLSARFICLLSIILVECCFCVVVFSSEWRTVFTKDGEKVECSLEESPDIVPPVKCFDSEGGEIKCLRNSEATWRSNIKPDDQCRDLMNQDFYDSANDRMLKLVSCGIHDDGNKICMKFDSIVSEQNSFHLCEYLAAKFEAEYMPPLKKKWEMLIISQMSEDFILARCLLY